MAEKGECSSEEPSFMFRMTLSGIEKKWPKAKQLSTETLYHWIQEAENSVESPELIILARIK